VETLEDRTVLSTFYALASTNSLLRFDSATPGTIQSTLNINGLQTGENLVGIDFRPVTGQLYGVTSANRLVTLDLTNGNTTQVGTAPFSPGLNGTRFGVDFNPLVDRLRVVSDTGQNIRLNPSDGTVTVDTNLNPGTPHVVAIAYSNKFGGTAATVLYGIDSTAGTEVLINPPNSGMTSTIGPLGVTTSDRVGFKIVGGAGGGTAGQAFASLTVGGQPRLYSINIGTGAATLIGTIGNGSQTIVSFATVTDGFRYMAIGGSGGKVRVLGTDGTLISEFAAFGSSANFSVNVAVGDLNRDGIPDLVVAPAAGNPQIKIYNGAAFANRTFSTTNPDASLLIPAFFAYGQNFNIGANVAIGDLTGDSINDLVTAPTAGNPHVKIINGAAIADRTLRQGNLDTNTKFQFFAYGLNFNVGASVAVGDLNRDGSPELVTGALPGNPHVKVFNGTAFSRNTFNPANPDASLLTDFFAYGINFNIGANVAIGDVTGDGFLDLITGPTSGNPQVRVFDGNAFRTGTFDRANPTASETTNFFAFGQGVNIGARVGVVDFGRDGIGKILTGSTTTPLVRVFRGTARGNMPANIFEATISGFSGGVSVGG
jgi:hypothetical protein